MIEILKEMFISLSLAEHPGDVASTLVYYAPKFGLPDSEYDEERERYVWPWEELEPLETKS